MINRFLLNGQLGDEVVAFLNEDVLDHKGEHVHIIFINASKQINAAKFNIFYII